MAKMYPSQNLKQVLLRIPEKMRADLEAAAEENGRSLTMEVIARLEMTFPKDENWLSKMQNSPHVQIERRQIAFEVEWEEKMEALRADVDAIKSKLGI